MSPDLRRTGGTLRFRFGFSCGAIVTLEIFARSVANIRQLERGLIGQVNGLRSTALEAMKARQAAVGIAGIATGPEGNRVLNLYEADLMPA